MMEREHFIKPIEIEITAATIGINKHDWFCHRPGDKRIDIIEKIKLEKFDIVPIENKQGVCTSYFTFDGTKLNSHKIYDSDKIYYLTHVRDIIWSMCENKKNHYFLSNGRNENDIVGLISLSNLNSRDFYLYLFNIISFLEVEFAHLIESNKEEAFEILNKAATTKELKAQLEEIIARFYEDITNENENHYKEYLYLSNLISIIKHEGKYKSLKYSTVTDFEKNIGIVRDIRNGVAHPVKSLVRNFDDLERINKGISKIFELREKVKSCRQRL